MERGSGTENIRTDYGSGAAGFQDPTNATLCVNFNVFTRGKIDGINYKLILKVSGFRQFTTT